MQHVCTMNIDNLLGMYRSGGGSEFLPLADRNEAGVLLAERLARFKGEDVLVLGIPRGGVVIAAIIADALGAELDVIVARKLGAPLQPELALGAVTADGTQYINSELVEELRVDREYLSATAREQQAEARRREERFRGNRPPPPIEGRTVIITDDGLATGATMLAAVHAVKRQRPARLIVAVPVGAAESCAGLRGLADEVICLAEPSPFYAVGLHYKLFPQVSDDEVVEILSAARARQS